jgi:two-component system capsular synthesis response regulator RcsB
VARAPLELSRREEEVLLLFVSGLTVSEIARKLYRSIKTVSTHKIAVMNKLGINKDIDLIRYGIEMGWVDVRK